MIKKCSVDKDVGKLSKLLGIQISITILESNSVIFIKNIKKCVNPLWGYSLILKVHYHINLSGSLGTHIHLFSIKTIPRYVQLAPISS